MPTAKLRGRYGRLSLQTISPEKRRWAEQPSRSRMFRQTPTGPGNSSAGMDRARQVANVAVPMDQARTKWRIFLPIAVLRPTPLRKGVAFWPPSPHFASPIYFQHSLQTPALSQAGRTSCSLDSSRGPVRPMNRQLAYLHSRSHRAFLLCTHSLGKPALC